MIYKYVRILKGVNIGIVKEKTNQQVTVKNDWCTIFPFPNVAQEGKYA